MEADKDPFPELKIFEPLARLSKIARFVGERLLLCDEQPNTGAAPFLDDQLSDHPRLFDPDELS